MDKERLSLPKNELEINSPYDYYCLIALNEWRVVNAIPLRRMLLKEPNETRDFLMSLRLSTGVMGELDCPSGDSDYVPKGFQEVIVGWGQEGIKALLELGALPCISCHSGKRLATLNPEIAMTLEKSVKNLGNVDDPSFLIEQYDARRLDWSKILPLGIAPQRFYTRPNLNTKEISAIKNMFEQGNVAVPAIGYYDRTREDRFYKYC